MENKFIYISRNGKTLTFDRFNKLLKGKDPNFVKLFLGLQDGEKGCNGHKLFTKAVKPAVKAFWAADN